MASKALAGGLSGAATGAATGATVGAAFTPVGSAIGAVVGAIVMGGIGAYMGNEADKLDDGQKRNLENIARIIEEEWELPPERKTKLTSEQYKLLTQYTPELIPLIEESEPQRISGLAGSKYKSNQDDALSRYLDMATDGQDVISNAQEEQAQFDADARAKGRRSQITNEYSSRGLGGSNMELLSNIAGNQNDDVAARELALKSNINAQGRRTEALDKYTNLSGKLRNEEQATEASNVQIMNDFNQRNIKSRRMVAEQNNKLENDARLVNTNAAQQNADRNVAVRNQDEKYNMEQDRIALIERVKAKNQKLLAKTGQQNVSSDFEYKTNKEQLGATAEGVGAVTSAITAYGAANKPKDEEDSKVKKIIKGVDYGTKTKDFYGNNTTKMNA